MSKYKVGQRVRILPNLNRKEHNKNPGLMSEMLEMRGQVVTIIYISDDGNYNLKEDSFSYNWHEDWLMPIKVDKDEAFEMLVRGEISEETYNELIKGE